MSATSLKAWAMAAGLSPQERGQRQQLQQMLIARGCLWPSVAIPFTLKLGDFDALTQLPEGLDIKGHLDLSGCRALRQLPAQLRVGRNLCVQDCPRLEALSGGAEVGGEVRLCGCPALRALPDTWRVGGSLVIDRCDGLEHLGSKLQVGGRLEVSHCGSLKSLGTAATLIEVKQDLIVRGCRSLQRLADRLVVPGKLEVTDCGALTALAAQLTVHDQLHLSACAQLEQLGDHAQVGCSLVVRSCPAFRQLPDGLRLRHLQLQALPALTVVPEDAQVREELVVEQCPRLQGLPPCLQVQREVRVDGCDRLATVHEGLFAAQRVAITRCPGLVALPATLRRLGHLSLDYCINLAQLPDFLALEGGLSLVGCRGMDRLPEGLWVGRSLDLSDMDGLTSLPASSLIGGHLVARGCRSLADVPAQILRSQLPDTSQQQRVSIDGADVLMARKEQLQQALGTSVRVEDGTPEVGTFDKFSGLEQAVASFFAAAKLPAGAQIPPTDALYASSAERQRLTSFLARLQNLEDYRRSSRPVAQRVLAMLVHMSRSPASAAICHRLVADSLSSCNNAIGTGLNNLDLEVRVSEASEAANPQQALRQLGLGMCRLQQVRDAAAQFAQAQRIWDLNDVQLRFEVALAKPLGLPVISRSMEGPKPNSALQQHLRAVEAKVAATDDRSAAFAAFLAGWPPHQRLQRQRQAASTTFLGLPQAPPAALRPANERCPITLCTQTELAEPVVFAAAEGKWLMFEMEAAKRAWVEDGRLPTEEGSLPLASLGLLRRLPAAPALSALQEVG